MSPLLSAATRFSRQIATGVSSTRKIRSPSRGQYGSTKPYTAWVVPINISDHQDNVFKDNTYTGPWNFDGFALGDTVSWSQWTSGFRDDKGSDASFGAQDAGSTYNQPHG